MVTLRRNCVIAAVVLTAVLLVGVGFWLANRIGNANPQLVDEEATNAVPGTPRIEPPPKVPFDNGVLPVASPEVEQAVNQARSSIGLKSTARNATPADTFIFSISALLKGDIRTFALAMSKPAQFAFLDGRSIDDPSFDGLPHKMAEIGFHSYRLESFEADSSAGHCKISATISSVRGNQKIYEQIAMELSESSSGWMIEKYTTRMTKLEPFSEDKR